MKCSDMSSSKTTLLKIGSVECVCVCLYVCVCVCVTVWLGDMLLDEQLVVSYNFYKADLETGVKARGFDSCVR